jgi:hypothetical protein
VLSVIEHSSSSSGVRLDDRFKPAPAIQFRSAPAVAASSIANGGDAITAHRSAVGNDGNICRQYERCRHMRTDLDFFDSKLQPHRAALSDCFDEICRKLDEWGEAIAVCEPSKGEEHATLWAAVYALEKLHRQVSGPDITRWLASWAGNQLRAEIFTITDCSDSDDRFPPRRAALLDRLGEINLKLKEWDDKINLGGPSKGEEHATLWAAIHALEKLHRQVRGRDITRWFVSWVKNQVMAEIYTID